MQILLEDSLIVATGMSFQLWSERASGGWLIRNLVTPNTRDASRQRISSFPSRQVPSRKSFREVFSCCCGSVSRWHSQMVRAFMHVWHTDRSDTVSSAMSAGLKPWGRVRVLPRGTASPTESELLVAWILS